MCKSCNKLIKIAQQLELTKDDNNCYFCGKPSDEQLSFSGTLRNICTDCSNKVIECSYDDCGFRSLDPEYFKYLRSDLKGGTKPFCSDHSDMICYSCGLAICSDLTEFQGKKYHEDCFNEDYTVCDECGDTTDNDDITFSDILEKSLCDSCYKQLISKCKDCDKEVDKDDAIVINGYRDEYLCQRCYENGYFTCPDCDSGRDVYPSDDGVYDEDSGNMYCPEHAPDTEGGIDETISTTLASRAVSAINEELGTLYPIENKSIEGNIIPVLNAALKRYKDLITESSVKDILSKIKGSEQKAAVELELESSETIQDVINTFQKLKEYNIKAKTSYPLLKGFKPLPVKAELATSHHDGLTIRIPVDKKVLSFAEKACPGAQEAYEKYLEGRGHHDALCYVRLTESEGAIIIDNVQTDWDIQYVKGILSELVRNLDYFNHCIESGEEDRIDQYKRRVAEIKEKIEAYKKLEPVLRWWVNAIDKFFIPYILDYVKQFSQNLGMPAYLTSFDMQKTKWNSLPQRSSDIYETIPSQMGFKKERHYSKPESLKRDRWEMTRIAKLLELFYKGS